MVAITASAAPLAPSEMAMSNLRRGDRGRVLRVVGESSEAVRLRALGLCEGRQIEILRTGDAWVVRVLGSRIGLSSQLAASVVLAAA